MKPLLSCLLLLLCFIARANDQVIPWTNGDWGPPTQKALQACADSGGGRVTFAPAPTLAAALGQRHYLTPVVVTGTPFCRFSLYLDSDHNTLEDDHAGDWFRTLGWKWGEFSVRGVNFTVPGSTGLHIDGDAAHQSTGHIEITHCEFETTATNCTAIQLGSGTSNDVSEVHISGTEFYSNVWGTGTLAQQLANVHKAGNVFLRCTGGNTLRITVDHSTASGCDVGISTCGYPGANNGGDGLLIHDFGGSYTNCYLWTDPQFDSVEWDGGRIENSGSLWLAGAPLVLGGGDPGLATFRSINFDGCLGGAVGYCDPGAYFQANGNCQVSIDACSGKGNAVDPAHWFTCRGRPTLTASRSIGVAATVKAIEGSVGTATSTQ